MPKGVYLRKNKKTPQELAEKKKSYQKKYRSMPENAEKAKIARVEYAKTEKRITYRKKYREETKQRDKEKRIKKKHSVLKSMGGKCVRCGFDDFRALQIDHINADGYLDKKKGISNGEQYYIRVLVSFLKKENKYQLLCANCNWIKRFDNNEHYKR